MVRILKFVVLAVVTTAVALVAISYIPGASSLIASLQKKAA